MYSIVVKSYGTLSFHSPIAYYLILGNNRQISILWTEDVYKFRKILCQFVDISKFTGIERKIVVLF